jgi:hypothetical protein
MAVAMLTSLPAFARWKYPGVLVIKADAGVALRTRRVYRWLCRTANKGLRVSSFQAPGVLGWVYPR